jgi:hypothetical protein
MYNIKTIWVLYQFGNNKFSSSENIFILISYCFKLSNSVATLRLL